MDEQPNLQNTTEDLESTQESPLGEIEEKPIIPEISWEAPEFLASQKDTQWFILIGVIMGLLIIYFLIIRQWIAAATFAVMTIAIFRFAKTQPRVVQCKISSQGIALGEKMISFNDLVSFAIIETNSTLHLEPKKKTKLILDYPIPFEIKEEIRSILKNHLSEVPKSEHLADKISRWVGF